MLAFELKLPINFKRARELLDKHRVSCFNCRMHLFYFNPILGGVSFIGLITTIGAARNKKKEEGQNVL